MMGSVGYPLQLYHYSIGDPEDNSRVNASCFQNNIESRELLFLLPRGTPTRTPEKEDRTHPAQALQARKKPTLTPPAEIMPRGKNQPPDMQGREDIESWSNRAPTLTTAPRRSACSTKMTRNDLVDLPSEVTNSSLAYKFLRSAGFTTEDDPNTSLPQLALILLQITQWAKIPMTGVNAIRSIAFILKAFKMDALSQNISNKVNTALIPQIDKLREDWEKVCLDISPPHPAPDSAKTLNNLTPDDWEYVCQSLEDLSQKANINADILNCVSETLGNTGSMVESVATRLDNIVPPTPLLDVPHINEPFLESVKTSLEEIRECLSPAGAIPNQPYQNRPCPSSYASVVTGNNLNHTQKEITTKSEAHSRQVIIKCSADNIKSLTKKELTAIATMALNLPIMNTPITSDHQSNHPTFFCHNTKKTKGDIIILEMSNKEGAKWLSDPSNKLDFIDRFNPDSKILEPSFKTKVEFIPITLDAESPLHHRDIEIVSDLPPNSIRRISWMCNLASCKPHQKVTHMFITFNSPEAANKAVRNGLRIEGKKVMATHTHPEPMHCFHCQRLHKHLINNCPESEDTCGTCGKHDHRMPQCQETCTDHFYCVNCETYQHASWD